MEEEIVNICYCGNDKMFKGVLLSSLSASYSCICPISVYILTADLRSGRKHYSPFTAEQGDIIEKALQQHNPKNKVIVLDVGELFKKDFRHCINFHSTYTPYAYMRLVLDGIPNMPDKMLYLDTDTIVTRPLAPLFEFNMDAYDIAFVPDAIGRYYFGKRYGNTGVLFINLRKVRMDGSFIKARWLVNHIRMFMPDQTALNIVCRNTKLLLPNIYNEQLDLHDDTVIRHYCKRLYWLPFPHTINIKPWNVAQLRRRFGGEIHKALLNEYLMIVEELNKKEKAK